MYQIDNSTAAVAQPASTAAGSGGFFTDGNPATGVAATIVPAEWLNAVMLELCNLVTGAGLALTKNAFDQVIKAIRVIGKQRVILVDTGAVNAYAGANTPALVSGTWVDGFVQLVKIANANTGPSTYSPDGLAAIPIYGLGLSALQGGELRAGGVAALVKATIPGINSGNPICVLLECYGGSLQISAGTQSGHAVNLGQVFGIGQTLQSVLGSRAIGTTYTNSTGKPIFISVEATSAGGSNTFGIFVGSLKVGQSMLTAGSGTGCCANAIIPAGASYNIQQTGSFTLTQWNELR